MLYGRQGRGPERWAMTERGRAGVEREPHALRIGRSTLQRDADRLVIDIDEVGMPIPQRLRGRLVLHLGSSCSHPVELSPNGRHRWFPIAPAARVEVEMQQPGLRWSGSAYHDANQGDAPLEHAFERWHWSRAHLADGRAAVFYDVERQGLEPLNVALGFDARSGRVQAIEQPPQVALAASRWGVVRMTRSDAGHPPRVLQTLTDAPFYARSLVDAQWSGQRVTALHESLSMARFAAPWVQAMLPFRIPRRRV